MDSKLKEFFFITPFLVQFISFIAQLVENLSLVIEKIVDTTILRNKAMKIVIFRHVHVHLWYSA